MKDIVNRNAKRVLEACRAHKRLLFFLLLAAAAAAIAVPWLQRGTGVALTGETFCGREAHQHTEECFSQILHCDETEEEPQIKSSGHRHTEECYAYEEVLLCGLEESAGHQHGEECYEAVIPRELSDNPSFWETEFPVEEYVLACGQEEAEGHSHTEECFGTEKMLICGQEEAADSASAAAHVHTEDCYGLSLICELEEHSHKLQCFSDMSADLETAADWEATLPMLSGIWADDVVAVASSQLGYQESSRNYLVPEDADEDDFSAESAVKKGYTRYGAWYGDPYGDWCAMFASFCLHYAGVPEERMPLAAETSAWAAGLADFGLYTDVSEARPGDLLFFSMGNEKKIDHVGIVSHTEYDYDGTGTYGVRALSVIEGNSADAVRENFYDAVDERIMGCGRLPEQNLPEAMLETEETEEVNEIVMEEETEEVTEIVMEEETETVTETELETEIPASVRSIPEEGPHEDFDEEQEQTTDHISITIHWLDESDADQVRPTSVTFNLIYRTFYEAQDSGGSLKQDSNGLFYDPSEDKIVKTLVLRQADDMTGTGDDLWEHYFSFDQPLSYNVFEEETYGASFYETRISESGDCAYTVTNTLRTEDVIFAISGQGGTDGRVLDRNYRDGHYYHIDVRVDASYTYVYYGDELVLVNGTDLYVTKNWITTDSSHIPDTVTFYVTRDNGDGTTTPLYWDKNGLQTAVPTGRRISLTISKNADGSWSTASISLDGGSYALEEISVDGFVSDITYITIDENAGDKDADSYYVHEGSVSVDAVNWVLYELNDNHDSSYVYYQNGQYKDYVYGRLDGGLYTDPHEAQSNNGEDYEFFLDNRNSVGGRGLYYLTDQSSIWVNLDYSYSYTDENGQRVENSVYGYSFEFTPEQWLEENLCLSKDHADSQAGVDLLIDGDTLMGLILDSVTRTEIDSSVVNTAEGTETVYLRGEKTWYDEEGRVETDHDNAAEMKLKLYRSADGGNSWETLREGKDYVVQWVGDAYYIYGSGGGGVFTGLVISEKDLRFQYKVEEEPVEGYTQSTHTSVNPDEGHLYETSWNFVNSRMNGAMLPETGGSGSIPLTAVALLLGAGAAMAANKNKKGEET